jgi:hypothetical protein
MRDSNHLFNFRDVSQRLGIPPSNKNNWAIGHILSSAAQKRGVPVHRPLTEKTDPNPTVSARHCIAAYPMTFFDEALKIVGEWWGEERSQGDLFE